MHLTPTAPGNFRLALHTLENTPYVANRLAVTAERPCRECVSRRHLPVDEELLLKYLLASDKSLWGIYLFEEETGLGEESGSSRKKIPGGKQGRPIVVA